MSNTAEKALRDAIYLIAIIITLIILFVTIYHVNKSELQDPVKINVKTNETEYVDYEIGIPQMIEIGNGLYYDNMTKIVYWWNGSKIDKNNSTMPTAYYMSNGHKAKYDPEHNRIEEIIE